MINVQDIRKGNIFKFEGDMWNVMTMQHVSPGKGGAFVKVKSRSLSTGKQKDMNFRSGEKIEKIDVFMRDATYSYAEGDDIIFMDAETFEQYTFPRIECEDVLKYVIENGKVIVSIYNEQVISVEAPNFVTLPVTHSEPGAKGDTVTKATKYVEIETGHKIEVPLFINEGDLLKIDTRTGEYLERVKN